MKKPRTKNTMQPLLQLQLAPPECVFPGVKPAWVNELPPGGIFLTGIEGSDPIVAGNTRRNLFREAHNFYEHYKARLQNIQSLGITWLRFGPPYSEAHTAPGKYNFEFADKVLEECKARGITVVADLLHFGLPDWMGNEDRTKSFYQNAEFPDHFAAYAREFAKRYPHIRYYTVINEPFITALFSAKYGMWNEQLVGGGDDDRAFVNASCNISRAAVLAREAIEEVWEEEQRPGVPVFVQNESFEKAYVSPRSKRHGEVEQFNLRRFVLLDLILGKADDDVFRYLLRQGMSEPQYAWFMEHGKPTNTILGVDHYPTCVHTYYPTRVQNHTAQHIYELYGLVREYWGRYRIPMLHTEANAWSEAAVHICWQTFANISQLRLEGVPVLGMGWYGDEYQVGWVHALTRPDKSEIDPVGLFYQGQVEPVGLFFKDLVMRGLPPIRGW